MNDVLSVFMIAFACDLSNMNSDKEGDVCSELHHPRYFWSETYFMFERIMELGVKGIYYKDGGRLKIKNFTATT